MQESIGWRHAGTLLKSPAIAPRCSPDVQNGERDWKERSDEVEVTRPMKRCQDPRKARPVVHHAGQMVVKADDAAVDERWQSGRDAQDFEARERVQAPKMAIR